jgi:hypothetical protein
MAKKFPKEVVGRVLNHKTGVSDGLEGVYQQEEFIEERKQALEYWGAYVQDLVECSGPK